MPHTGSNQFEKEPSRSSFLHVDGVSSREKAAWVKAAHIRGKKLAEWVIESLNEESDRTQRGKDRHE